MATKYVVVALEDVSVPTIAGQSLKVLRVNTGETALEFAAAGSGDLKSDGTVAMAADFQFAQFEALQFVFENRTSDPGSPVAGQCWLRTDL